MSHPNFTLEEMRCKDGTPVPIEFENNADNVLSNLQVLRDAIGEAIHINSGYRTPAYNAKVGGKPHSQHMQGAACDITVKSMTPKQVHKKILELIKAGKMHNGGLGLYPGFVHYDVREKPARW
jgi:uncharacterized protein YcbK (DUF882 family)